MYPDCNITWDSESWLKRFNGENVDYRKLRREVWENTKAIVEANGYTSSDKKSVLLSSDSRGKSSFYCKAFTASFEPLTAFTEVTVVADDCLDVAHRWLWGNDELEVCVLNMASRRNPGGGVTKGAGAQEEYLFRCSDYYKFLYRYASYAGEYGLTRSHYQYPLDQNFGGIYSPGVTIFRENEKSGYKLTASPWKVNMIAVAGMNSPDLILENGKERIAPELVEGVKNKIRTIFRIACEHGQRNLVLGALGCGAFHNPPEHVAELFRDVICEKEFEGAFSRICFAVKTDHNSHGDRNYLAFKEILDGFVPEIIDDTNLLVRKIAIARDVYATLMKNGNVFITDFSTGESRQSKFVENRCIDIAAGFDHIVGLLDPLMSPEAESLRENFNDLSPELQKQIRKDLRKSVEFEAVGSQAPKFSSYGYREEWYRSNAISVAACEGHSAALQEDGTVLCDDYFGMDTRGYKERLESLRNVKQLELTFEKFYYLTNDGKFMSGNGHCNREEDFFNNGREIVQITAFGCYYSMITVAALYADGTVKASYDGVVIKEVEEWRNVKKICCGNHGAVFGLTNDGKVLLPQDYPYRDREYEPVTEIHDAVVDIAANFDRFIALTSHGKLIYLHEGR